MKLILASSSPRRKEMLEWLGYEFTLVTSGFDEDSVKCDEVEDLVEELALQKAAVVARENQDAIVIGADSMLSYQGEAIGKAKDKQDAKRILQQLSGKTHQVITGVSIIDCLGGESITFHESSLVTFRNLEPDEIDAYLESDVWQDKAGAYAIQDDPHHFVAGYDGSYTNIIGLPLVRLTQELENLGLEVGEDVVAIIEQQTGQREKEPSVW